MIHFRVAQEAETDMGPMSIPGIKTNVLPFDRRKVCVEVNRITAEQLVLSCTDEDLAVLCRDLSEEVVKTQVAYDVAREALAKALNEKSRRAGRG